MHERLIPPIRQLTGVLLAEVQQAGMVLDRRFAEWSDGTGARLRGSDLKLVRRHFRQLQLAIDRAALEKRTFFRSSVRNARLGNALLTTGALSVVALGAFWLYADQRERRFEELRRLVGSTDAHIQIEALSALRDYTDERIVPSLVASHTNQLPTSPRGDHAAIRENARLLVVRGRAHSSRWSTPLPDAASRQSGIELLGAVGSDAALGPLIAGLEDEEERVRIAAVSALSAIKSDKAVVPLIALTNDDDWGLPGAAASALGAIKSEKAVAALIAALKAEEGLLRSTAASTLGAIKNEKAVDPLIAAMNDDERSLRNAAASALGEIGSDKAVDPLIAALEGPKSDLRRTAGLSLGQIKSERAVKPLIRALEDRDWIVRESAARSLGRLPFPESVRVSSELMSSAFHSVRRAVLAGRIEGVFPAIDDVNRRLLSRDLRATQVDNPFILIDPIETISIGCIRTAARKLDLREAEVRKRYEELAKRLGLKVARPV